MNMWLLLQFEQMKLWLLIFGEDKENVVYTHNGMLYSLIKKKRKSCHMLQHGWTWKHYMFVSEITLCVISEISPHGRTNAVWFY